MADVSDGWKALAMDAAKAVFYVILIILCVLMAPEEPLKFIYTEF